MKKRNISSLDSEILNIVRSYVIKEQIDIRSRLNARGHAITQSSLSRRLKKLQIVKVGNKYEVFQERQPHLPPIINIQVSKSGVIVLHTHPGNANCIGSFIDSKYVSFDFHESLSSLILGTIAGDDTLLIILNDIQRLNEFIIIIKKDFPYLDLSHL